MPCTMLVLLFPPVLPCGRSGAAARPLGLRLGVLAVRSHCGGVERIVSYLPSDAIITSYFVVFLSFYFITFLEVEVEDEAMEDEA